MQVRFAEKLRSRKPVVWFLERLQKTRRLSTISFSKKSFIQHWNDFVSFLYGGYSKNNKEQKNEKAYLLFWQRSSACKNFFPKRMWAIYVSAPNCSNFSHILKRAQIVLETIGAILFRTFKSSSWYSSKTSFIFCLMRFSLIVCERNATIDSNYSQIVNCMYLQGKQKQFSTYFYHQVFIIYQETL